eukprot:9002510-Lingulodinium_polyedra.AAC.1
MAPRKAPLSNGGLRRSRRAVASGGSHLGCLGVSRPHHQCSLGAGRCHLGTLSSRRLEGAS